ncbi:MAG: alpha/beta hydrolase-fold protein, partial [Planctomycetota bacterium]
HRIRFVFPHAPSIPVTVNGGMVMPAWYDILSMDFDRRVDEGGVRASGAALEALVAREMERGVAPGRIVLAGFSQGGAIALHTGLRFPERLAGIMALSTYIAADCDLEAERAPANADVPVLQCHGTEDPVVGFDKGEAARARLEGLGYGVEWHPFRMEHQVIPAEIVVMGAWMRRVLPALD